MYVLCRERVALQKTAGSHVTRLSDNASLSPAQVCNAVADNQNGEGDRLLLCKTAQSATFLLTVSAQDAHGPFIALGDRVPRARFTNAQRLPTSEIYDVIVNARVREKEPDRRRHSISFSDWAYPGSGNINRLESTASHCLSGSAQLKNVARGHNGYNGIGNDKRRWIYGDLCRFHKPDQDRQHNPTRCKR
jgi:hypothetical protein